MRTGRSRSPGAIFTPCNVVPGADRGMIGAIPFIATSVCAGARFWVVLGWCLVVPELEAAPSIGPAETYFYFDYLAFRLFWLVMHRALLEKFLSCGMGLDCESQGCKPTSS